jgi:hypothetical protein
MQNVLDRAVDDKDDFSTSELVPRNFKSSVEHRKEKKVTTEAKRSSLYFQKKLIKGSAYQSISNERYLEDGIRQHPYDHVA